MSRATELAAAEAEAAEIENPDAEEPEPIQPDEPDAEEEEVEEEERGEPSSLTSVQNIDRALNAEQKRHAKALEKAFGEQWAAFDQCPLCQVDGYVMQYQPGEVGPEQRAAILQVMGEGGAPDLGQHPSEVRCPVCDGWGEMLNGSRRPEQATSACQRCMGTGHLDRSQLVQEAPAPAAPVYPWSEPAAAPAQPPFGDQWGRPTGHPDYGIDPSQIVATVRSA